MRLIEPLRFAAMAAVLAVAAPALAQTAPPAHPGHPAAAPAPRTWARYASAREVQLRDVAAVVRVTPENRTDVAISVLHRGPLDVPTVRVRGDRLVVDGNSRRQITGCRGNGPDFQVDTNRHGRLRQDQLTVIDLRVPQNAVISAGGGVRFSMGPSQSAQVAIQGCGDADIENVADDIELSVSGSSDVRLYGAGEASVSLAGAGDVVVGAVRDGLTVSIAGSGDLVVARADGPTNIAVQGAGDVLVRDGRATSLTIAIAGAGDVVHNGSAEQLDAAIFGAGDVRVRRVDGNVSRRVLGVGEVIVGR